MSRFDGEMIKNVLEIPKEGWVEMASSFAEGNKELEEFLLFLWGKGFNTIGCCAGHEEEDCAVPYICIDITKLSDIQLKNLLKILYFNVPSRVSSSITNRFDKENQKRFAIYFNDYQANFKYIHSLFASILKFDKEVGGNVLTKEAREKFEILYWAMKLDMSEYAKSLIIPSVNFFEVQDMNSKESFVFISRCVELEDIKSQKELKDKIKNTSEFDGYAFYYKDKGKIKTLEEENFKNLDNIEILSAEKGMAGRVMSPEMMKESLAFIEKNELEK